MSVNENNDAQKGKNDPIKPQVNNQGDKKKKPDNEDEDNDSIFKEDFEELNTKFPLSGGETDEDLEE